MAYYKGNLCLIEWKSSEKDKTDVRDLYEYPVQLAAYVGAFLNDPNYKDLKEKQEFKSGLVIHLNKSNGKVDVHEINYQLMEYYWYQWLMTLKKFWNLVLLEHKRTLTSF